MDTTTRSNHHWARIGLATLCLAALLAPTAPAPAQTRAFTVIGSVSEETRTNAERAVAIYQSAGIDLPHFYLREGCHPGDHQSGAGHKPKAWYSTTAHSSAPTVTACAPACLRVMLHELAHHWDLTVLGQAHRDHMTQLLGVDGWLSPELTYRERGGEQWANIIAWGLMPCDILGKTESWGGDPTMNGRTRTQIGHIFTLSTGSAPLHGYQFDPDQVCG